jgi:hypothetical protein
MVSPDKAPVLPAAGKASMRQATKVLRARHNAEQGCLAADGEFVIAAWPGAKGQVALRRRDHFFVGLASGKPSLYGWVEELSEPIAVDELTEEAMLSSARADIGDTLDQVRRQVLLTLSSIADLRRGTPVVCDFTERSFRDKTLVQKIHRVFFR